jgi:heme/copper-type cytochrome/quinol oxidase subunit 2
MHALKTLAAVAACLTITACASGGTTGSMARLPDGPGAGRQLGAPSVEPAVVRVSNYNWMDVVVYAVQGNRRVRLGQVTTMGTTSFRLPSAMTTNTTQTVRLMVDPVGSTQGWQTEGISVQAGQQVQFNVQNALQLSSVLVSR